MSEYRDIRLDELGISSREEAEELELELDVRFGEFSFRERETWMRQNEYLAQHAMTRTVSTSAWKAGVTVYTVRAWKRNDTLGFTRRLEVADLEFCDRLQDMALERAGDPGTYPSLLIAMLRANMPEKYSLKGEDRDGSKSEEMLHLLRENSVEEQEKGHPGIRALARRGREFFSQEDVSRATQGDSFAQDGGLSAARETGRNGFSPDDVSPGVRETRGNGFSSEDSLPGSRAERRDRLRRDRLRRERKMRKRDTLAVVQF